MKNERGVFMTLLATDDEILQWLAESHQREAKWAADSRGLRRIAQVLHRAARLSAETIARESPCTIERIAASPLVGDRITDGDSVWVVMADDTLDQNFVRVWSGADGAEQVMSAEKWATFCNGKQALVRHQANS